MIGIVIEAAISFLGFLCPSMIMFGRPRTLRNQGAGLLHIVS
jgi:hypothetical protein